MDYIFHDVVDELIGTDAAFGVSLGDNVADDPELMDEISRELHKSVFPGTTPLETTTVTGMPKETMKETKLSNVFSGRAPMLLNMAM